MYKGKTLDELQAMDRSDIIKIVSSNIRRSLKRGFTPEESKLLKRVEKLKKSKADKTIKTHCREMIILPSFVGLKMAIHNGKEFVPLDIKANMVFHRLGEFALTTKQVRHGSPGLRATRSSGFVPIK